MYHDPGRERLARSSAADADDFVELATALGEADRRLSALAHPAGPDFQTARAELARVLTLADVADAVGSNWPAPRWDAFHGLRRRIDATPGTGIPEGARAPRVVRLELSAAQHDWVTGTLDLFRQLEQSPHLLHVALQPHPRNRTVAAALLTLLGLYGLVERTMVSADERSTLRVLRQLQPRLRLGLAIPRPAAGESAAPWARRAARATTLVANLATPLRVAAAVRSGLIDELGVDGPLDGPVLLLAAGLPVPRARVRDRTSPQDCFGRLAR